MVKFPFNSFLRGGGGGGGGLSPFQVLVQTEITCANIYQILANRLDLALHDNRNTVISSLTVRGSNCMFFIFDPAWYFLINKFCGDCILMSSCDEIMHSVTSPYKCWKPCFFKPFLVVHLRDLS